jgi:hypothetical protein
MKVLVHFPNMHEEADAIFWYDGVMIDEYIPKESVSTREARYIVHKHQPLAAFRQWAQLLSERNPAPAHWDVYDIQDEDPRAWFDRVHR